MDTRVGIIFLLISGFAGALGNYTDVSINTTLFSTSGESMSIYDGTKSNIMKHPYLVMIQVDGSKYCTGTIVSESWVLTTAECAQKTRKSMHVLMYRRYNKVRAVKNVTLHPDYPSGIYDFDFACAQIQGKFHFSKGVQPVKIPRKSPDPGTVTVVAGWAPLGSRPSKGRSHSGVVEGTMAWQSDVSCNSTLSHMGITWTDRIACVYHRNKTTLCTGAWGAPAVKDGVLYGQFVGAQAEGFCSATAAPVILSDVSSVSDWVRDVTGAAIDQRVL